MVLCKCLHDMHINPPSFSSSRPSSKPRCYGLYRSQYRPAVDHPLPELSFFLDDAIIELLMYAPEEGRRALKRNEEAHTAANIWPYYFPEAEFSLDDRKYKLVAELADFLSSPEADTILSNVQYDSCVYLPIDFQQLRKVCLIEGFYADLREVPKEALLCMGAAVHMALLLKGNDYHIGDAEKINVRLYNHPDSLITLKSLKAAYIGKLVSVRGTVVKVSTVRPLITEMDFTCAKCGTTITRAFPDGKFSPPIGCRIQGCRSRTFTPVRSTAKAIDFQKIRLQEILKSGIHEEGRVPRTVECELMADLVDSCIPGDVVTVTGIIKGSRKPKIRAFIICIWRLFQLETRSYILFLKNISQLILKPRVTCYVICIHFHKGIWSLLSNSWMSMGRIHFAK